MSGLGNEAKQNDNSVWFSEEGSTEDQINFSDTEQFIMEKCASLSEK